jgi:ABC-2 type transport system permease protein
MSGFSILLKKELWQQIKTYRLLIVGCVFVFFGLTTPLMLKYLPEIIKLTGTPLPLEIPPPTAIESLAEYAGTVGQLGVLLTVLMSMGAIADELRRGTAVIILSKPVTRAVFVNAKLTAISLTFIVSLIAASLLCFGYTVWLIGPASVMPFIGLNLLLALFLIFCLSVTLLFSSLFRSSLAAGGLGIGVLILIAVLSAVPVIGDYLPGKLLGWGSELLAGTGNNYWWSLGVTLVSTIACTYGAQRLLKNKEF